MPLGCVSVVLLMLARQTARIVIRAVSNWRVEDVNRNSQMAANVVIVLIAYRVSAPMDIVAMWHRVERQVVVVLQMVRVHVIQDSKGVTRTHVMERVHRIT